MYALNYFPRLKIFALINENAEKTVVEFFTTC